MENKKYKNVNSYCLVSPKLLHTPCEEVDLEEGQEIARVLFEFLAKSKNGIGLSAIQLGIFKKVSVINVKEPLYFINPKIVNGYYPVEMYEECLSFPRKKVKVNRLAKIQVEALNLKEIITFGYQGDLSKDYINGEHKNKLDMKDLLECVCLQHEIDHCNSITMYDRRVMPTAIKIDKIQRNKKVTIQNKQDSLNIKEMKYKKAEPLINSGEWILI